MVHGAFVTAASSGIGAEFARQLGEIGLNVAIVAWRRPRLEELAHELEAKNRVRVKIIAADLSQSDFLCQLSRAFSFKSCIWSSNAQRKRGGIIFVSSVSGYLATPYEASYAASKLYEFFFG